MIFERMEFLYPKVSVIMATYNRAHFIEDSLDSILNQTYENWECIIIDDGSVDSTKVILQSYIKKDNRFKFFNRSDNHKKGLPGCRNMGLELANGEFIVFFDDDDIVHPQNINICIELLSKNNCSFIRYNKEPFLKELSVESFNNELDYKAEVVGINDVEEIVTGEISFASCTVMWRNDCFSNIRFNEELMYAEEWECFVRIITEGWAGISTNMVLYFNRKHAESNTGQFWNNDPVRMNSKVKAVKLVIDTLKRKDVLSKRLIKYFVRLGFMFKKPEIIIYALKQSEAGFIELWKYKLGYIFYPFLRPVFILYAKFNKS
tara:strand:+ start:16581 stop:17537 length:957 start_codon:yes stop_codon:yes gene_type:complete